jgi:hypothetical protein
LLAGEDWALQAGYEGSLAVLTRELGMLIRRVARAPRPWEVEHEAAEVFELQNQVSIPGFLRITSVRRPAGPLTGEGACATKAGHTL